MSAEQNNMQLAIVPQQNAEQALAIYNPLQAPTAAEPAFCIGDDCTKTYSRTSKRGQGRVVGVEMDKSGKLGGDQLIKVQWKKPFWKFWQKSTKVYDPAKLQRVLNEEEKEAAMAAMQQDMEQRGAATLALTNGGEAEEPASGSSADSDEENADNESSCSKESDL